MRGPQNPSFAAVCSARALGVLRSAKPSTQSRAGGLSWSMIRHPVSKLVCAALLALGSALPAHADAANKGLDVGDAAPALSAPQQDGTPFALDSLKGRVVYVDFFASWCAPCAEALPALDALYRKHADKGLTVVAVNVDTERAAALKMLKRIPVSYPVVFDPAGVWPETFGLRGMPSGYLLDRTGVVRFIKTGYQAKDLPKLVAAIEAELGRTQ
ncbi:MAG: TlpA family protein disulfide reductase [Pseudomonadota bacterium]|nr:TlpA family protein disulfide reductase [Pseudomonadota bacterium]